MLRLEANLLVIGNALKPAQIYAINEKLRLVSEEQNLKEKMVARDRVDLILKIFMLTQLRMDQGLPAMI